MRNEDFYNICKLMLFIRFTAIITSFKLILIAIVEIIRSSFYLLFWLFLYLGSCINKKN